MFDFNKEFPQEGSDILTTYNGQSLVLKNVYRYTGPITLQLLPFGGIQAVFDYQIIIYTKGGFFAAKEVVFGGKEFSSKDFILNNPHLVNTVLPN